MSQDRNENAQQPQAKTEKRRAMSVDEAKALLDAVYKKNPADFLAASNTIALEALAQAAELRDVVRKLVKECRGLYAEVRVLEKALAASRGGAPAEPSAGTPDVAGAAQTAAQQQAPRELSAQDTDERQQELENMMNEQFGPHPVDAARAAAPPAGGG